MHLQRWDRVGPLLGQRTHLNAEDILGAGRASWPEEDCTPRLYPVAGQGPLDGHYDGFNIGLGIFPWFGSASNDTRGMTRSMCMTLGTIARMNREGRNTGGSGPRRGDAYYLSFEAYLILFD
jgi:hypothetical protein